MQVIIIIIIIIIIVLLIKIKLLICFHLISNNFSMIFRTRVYNWSCEIPIRMCFYQRYGLLYFNSQFIGDCTVNYHFTYLKIYLSNKNEVSFLLSKLCFECFGKIVDKYSWIYRAADKSLARPGRKQATATEDFDVHISYLLS